MRYGAQTRPLVVFTSSLAVYGKAFDVGPFGPVCVGDTEVVVPCSSYGSQKLMAGAQGRWVKVGGLLLRARLPLRGRDGPQRVRGVGSTMRVHDMGPKRG